MGAGTADIKPVRSFDQINMKAPAIKLLVNDMRSCVDYYVATGLFHVTEGAEHIDRPACMVELQLAVSDISQIAILLEKSNVPESMAMAGKQSPAGDWIAHLYCADVSALYGRLQEKGAMLTQLYSYPWGSQFCLKDPTGNAFLFTQEHEG